MDACTVACTQATHCTHTERENERTDRQTRRERQTDRPETGRQTDRQPKRTDRQTDQDQTRTEWSLNTVCAESSEAPPHTASGRCTLGVTRVTGDGEVTQDQE